MVAPKSNPHSTQTSSNALLDLEKPFELRLRPRESAARNGRKFSDQSAPSAIRSALLAPVNGIAEPVIEWPGSFMSRAVCIDIDAPTGARGLPPHAVVTPFFPTSLPRPMVAFRSHGGGLKAVFVSRDEVPALDVASAWYVLAPLGGMRAWKAEVSCFLRHPRGLRPRENGVGHDRCGPIAWFAPSAHLILPRESAAEATTDDIASWLAERDLEYGRRSAAGCPMPGCGRAEPTSGSDPIDIGERGIRCYRCGRFASWGALVNGIDGTSRLALAAAERVHFPHQRVILRAAHPLADERLLRQAWWVLLHAAANVFPPPDATTDPEGHQEYAKGDLPLFSAAISDELPIVRGSTGSWLQPETYAARRIGVRTVTALPWASTPPRVDEALDVLRLSGFEPVHPINHGLLLPPRYTPPPGCVLVRRAPTEGELPAVDVSRRPSSAEVERAWTELTRLLPGLNRGYLSALIAAALRAHDADGVPPIAIATGGTGAGKNTTIEIAANVVGTRVAACKLAEPKETLRDFGLALEEGSTILNVNEVGRTPGVYSKLESILRIGNTIRYDVKNRNEATAPFRAAIVITGSTLPAAIVRAPEIERRAVGWRLTAPDGNWRSVGELSRARRYPQLRLALDVIAADLWWLLHDDARTWHTLARDRFEGSGISTLDLEDVGGEQRAAIVRDLYEAYRTASEDALTSHRGGPGWLPIGASSALFKSLSNFIDVESEERAQGATHDLQRLELGPILGFSAPRFSLLLQPRAREWRLKVVQIDAARGRGIPRSSWPSPVIPVLASTDASGTVGATSLSRAPSAVENACDVAVTHVTHVARTQSVESSGTTHDRIATKDLSVTGATEHEPALALLGGGEERQLHGSANLLVSWPVIAPPPPVAVQHLAPAETIVTDDSARHERALREAPRALVIDIPAAIRVTGSAAPAHGSDLSPNAIRDLARRAHQQLPALRPNRWCKFA